jgi:hypothetical protein
VNAHPEGLSTGEKRARSPVIREECEQMLRILDEQLEDLESITKQLQRKRQEWADKLDREQLIVPTASGRTRHGSVRALIFTELRSAREGMEGGALVRRIVSLVPTLNPQSVRQALYRLKQQGDVLHDGHLWRLPSNNNG